MGDFNWSDYPVADSGQHGSSNFNWEDHPVVSNVPEAATSPVTAATTGVMNGATLGMLPSLGALGDTTMKGITGVRGPLGGGTFQDLVDNYHQQRDQLEKEFATAAAAHKGISIGSNLAGSVGSLGLAGPAAVTPKGLLATGAISGVGYGPNVNSISDIPASAMSAAKGAGTNLAIGTAMNAATNAAAPYISKGLDAASGWLGNKAEGLAENATGATRVQADKFVPGTGRYLLDNDIVGFGDSPGDIAAKANSAMDAAQASKQDILNNQLSDTTVDRGTVIKYLKDKIASLSNDESQIPVVNKLQSTIDDISGVAGKTSPEVPITQSEQIRRGFDTNAKWNSNSDAPTLEANKIVAGAYRQAGEEAVTNDSPMLGSLFKSDKKAQQMLIPVADAAEKRATQLSQSPFGGLLDIASGGVGGSIGAHIGGPQGAAIGAAVGLGAKSLRPRVSSMAAVSADRLADVLKATPSAFGQFSGVLNSAAARGGASLGATDYLLHQTNQSYRDHKNQIFNPDSQEGEDNGP